MSPQPTSKLRQLALLAITAILALALAACGDVSEGSGSGSDTKAASTQESQAPESEIPIELSSPAVPPHPKGLVSKLPPKYTCDGQDTWPELRWQGIAPETEELALFTIGAQPAGEKLAFAWAVAGLDPELTEIEAGQLPEGAIVGRNSEGKEAYSICPKGAETYTFALYALPASLSPEQGFDAQSLREEAVKAADRPGLLAAFYQRG
jgi:phosphatidylethanolamine-binding protein (PEBP) family uncharacterized protein